MLSWNLLESRVGIGNCAPFILPSAKRKFRPHAYSGRSPAAPALPSVFWPGPGKSRPIELLPSRGALARWNVAGKEKRLALLVPSRLAPGPRPEASRLICAQSTDRSSVHQNGRTSFQFGQTEIRKCRYGFDSVEDRPRPRLRTPLPTKRKRTLIEAAAPKFFFWVDGGFFAARLLRRYIAVNTGPAFRNRARGLFVVRWAGGCASPLFGARRPDAQRPNRRGVQRSLAGSRPYNCPGLFHSVHNIPAYILLPTHTPWLQHHHRPLQSAHPLSR
ncbi:hypothetical protein CALVIDRAFT_172082 [Calocera viscosa TUFC12733]|uniref:Uncharacterized protein n=1 Tax=Calocera viscosa (strain TUFC12733) TaxID=1330018 RepID=A0A167L9T7_CALVF|nr:hypothetical protein CALVIDRAFT_172082 [Calocera viscosa TUFC12733]